jgi:hypothetical protein
MKTLDIGYPRTIDVTCLPKEYSADWLATAIRDKYPELTVVPLPRERILYMEKGKPNSAVEIDARSWLVGEGARLTLRRSP